MMANFVFKSVEVADTWVAGKMLCLKSDKMGFPEEMNGAPIDCKDCLRP